MASGLLGEIVQLIGHQPAIELLRAWGGRRIKVPAEIGQDHALAFCIGLEAARLMAKEYGGTDLDLPAERNILIDMRNDAIYSDFFKEKNITWLSRRYGLSRRQVNSILDKMGARDERMSRTAVTRT